jgi:hypothetical protein
MTCPECHERTLVSNAPISAKRTGWTAGPYEHCRDDQYQCSA